MPLLFIPPELAAFFEAEEARAMSYEKTTLKDLQYAARGTSIGLGGPLLDDMQALVEAENVQAIWVLVERWFLLMQSGEADRRYPDPDWACPDGRKPLTQELADLIVKEMDEDFDIEKGRYPAESGLGPEFSRLSPHARVAFAQEIYPLIMTSAEILTEAERRMQVIQE